MTLEELDARTAELERRIERIYTTAWILLWVVTIVLTVTAMVCLILMALGG